MIKKIIIFLIITTILFIIVKIFNVDIKFLIDNLKTILIIELILIATILYYIMTKMEVKIEKSLAVIEHKEKINKSYEKEIEIYKNNDDEKIGNAREEYKKIIKRYNELVREYNDLLNTQNENVELKEKIKSIENENIQLKNEIENVEKKKIFEENRKKRVSEHYKKIREKGKKYEEYVGEKYKLDGYSVHLNGIKNGVKDKGIDLICSKDNELILIQCKNWKKDSKYKINHEKLKAFVGSCTEYVNEKNLFNKNIKIIFITSNYIIDKSAEKYLEETNIIKNRIIEFKE